MPSGRAAVIGLAAAASLAYALLSYALMAHTPARAWAVAALFGPPLAALAAAAWQRRQLAGLLGCGALAALLGVVTARGGVEDLHRLYLLQHMGIHLALGATFALTLRPGATPLLTLLGERVHRQFTPAMRAYTRALTAGWTLYFVAMVGLSLALYAFAPWPWWSFYCTVLTPAAALALFVGEHLWRYRRHPEFERASLATVWRAYQRHAGTRTRR